MQRVYGRDVRSEGGWEDLSIAVRGLVLWVRPGDLFEGLAAVVDATIFI